MEDFIVPILFWSIALIMGISTCVKAENWQPLKDGLGVFLFLYVAPALLYLGIHKLNDFSGGNLGAIFFGTLICLLVVFAILEKIEEWRGPKESSESEEAP